MPQTLPSYQYGNAPGHDSGGISDTVPPPIPSQTPLGTLVRSNNFNNLKTEGAPDGHYYR